MKRSDIRAMHTTQSNVRLPKGAHVHVQEVFNEYHLILGHHGG